VGINTNDEAENLSWLAVWTCFPSAEDWKTVKHGAAGACGASTGQVVSSRRQGFKRKYNQFIDAKAACN
jgi:hypothetical protein